LKRFVIHLLLIVKSKGLIVILFGTMYVITFIYLPLINSAVFAYEKEGVKINFGIAPYVEVNTLLNRMKKANAARAVALSIS